MALGAPSLATSSVMASAVTVTTASFTPTAGALLVARAGVRATVLPGLPSIADTAGLAWTPLIAGLYDTGSGTRHRARLWAAVAGASPPAMTVTAASTNAGRMGLSVVQITGHGGIPSNAAAQDDATGDPTIVLPNSPDALSTVIAFLSTANTTAAVTPPAGFTELDDVTDGAGISLHCCYDATSPPGSVAYSTNGNTCVGIAVEVMAASGAGGIVQVRRRWPAMRSLLTR